ncbi:hypothetical protein EVAR_102423_1 [Eumeta japonica]|uniref:Uncharacterized protein n=1 Tax=Eumeta variegata TaxID=151549 RepID=A0A4C1YZY0_EUMVA|nr:hypothetical protein EVAR_102423_1 [Eumeta japonica]
MRRQLSTVVNRRYFRRTVFHYCFDVAAVGESAAPRAPAPAPASANLCGPARVGPPPSESTRGQRPPCRPRDPLYCHTKYHGLARAHLTTDKSAGGSVLASAGCGPHRTLAVRTMVAIYNNVPYISDRVACTRSVTAGRSARPRRRRRRPPSSGRAAPLANFVTKALDDSVTRALQRRASYEIVEALMARQWGGGRGTRPPPLPRFD